MHKDELKEWLGLRPADFIVYVATGAVVGMYFTKNVPLDMLLSVIAVVLCVVGCVRGMPADPRFSTTSNFIKKVAYPICLAGAVYFIYVNFTRWN